MNTENIKSPAKLAEEFGIPNQTVSNWLREGKIPAEKSGEGRGCRYKIARSDFESFLTKPEAGKHRRELPENPTPAEPPQPPSESTTERPPPASEEPPPKEGTFECVEVALSDIPESTETQMREKLNSEAIRDYAWLLTQGTAFPPIELFRDKNSGQLYVGDGFHRIAAHKEAGKAHIAARVHPGGKSAAIAFALAANAQHGLRRTSADKRKAIRIALREYPDLSNNEIARRCAVSESSVRNQRNQTDDSGKRIGSDGKKYPAKKRKPSTYRKVKAFITKNKTTSEDAQKLVKWLQMHFKLEQDSEENEQTA